MSRSSWKPATNAAAKIYESIGVCFGYTIARYCEFYDMEKLLILGRVTTGKGGDIILAKAAEVLKAEFPGTLRQGRVQNSG